MKLRVSVLVVLFLLGSAGSAYAQKVEIDFDQSADFTKYKTYAWIESQNPAPSDLSHRRIIAAIDERLAPKGLKKSPSNPDLFVVYNAGIKEQVSVQGYSYGYYPYRWGGGTVRLDQVVTLQATLVVDLVDAQKQELVWRGIASDTLSDKPEKNQKKLQKAMNKMFKKFPPKQ